MRLATADIIFWVAVLLLYSIAWLVLRHQRKDITYVGFIGLLTTGFFWRVLFGGAFIPAGGGDMAAILYPVYHFAQENLRQGIIPLWNPHLYAGIPFVGHIQSGPFYPPNLLLFFLTPEVTYRSLEYLLIAHFWLAGVLMYVMLRGLTPSLIPTPASRGARSARRRETSPSPVEVLSQQGNPPMRGAGGSGDGGLSRPAALLGAIVFMFNDFFITHVGNPNMVAVGAWLPLALLLFHQALAKRRAFYASLAGAVTGMAYLAGHIQPFLYILFVIGLYIAYVVSIAAGQRTNIGQTDRSTNSQVRTPNNQLSNPRTTKPPNHPTTQPTFVRLLVYASTVFLVYLVFTIAIAGISLVPNLEMSSQSLRESLSYGDAARFSLPPAEMIGLLVPALFGRGPDIHWGPWERVEVGYVGIMPLILAALAVIWRRERMPHFFVLLGLVSLLLAMGLYSVVHGWLFLIPGYSQIRVPARFVFLLDFAIAALAAYGFDALLRPLPIRWRVAWRKLFPVLAVALAAVILIFLPLMFVAVNLNQSQDPSIFNRTANGFNGLVMFALLLGTSIVLLLARRTRWLSKPMWRLAVVTFVALDLASLGAYLDSGEKDPSENFNHPQAIAFLKNDPSPFRIETPEGSWFAWQPNLGLIARLDDAAGIYNPLLLQRYDRYWKVAVGRDNTLYDLLNTKYLIVKKDDKASGKFTPVFDGDSQVNIYLNAKALPRAFMVYQSKVASNGDDAFAAIQQKDFDPTKTIILESGEPLSNASHQSAAISLKQRSTNSLEFEVTTDSDGYLFVGETSYPGWRASVDNQDASILRADYLFRAVKVPAGTHNVKLVFDPLSWKIGLGLTGLGLVGLVVGWLGRKTTQPPN